MLGVCTCSTCVTVLGSWVGVRRPFHLSSFLTASRVVLPQDPSTRKSHLGIGHVHRLALPCRLDANPHGRVQAASAAHVAHSIRSRLGEAMQLRSSCHAGRCSRPRSVLGSWGKAMRDAVRNKERWEKGAVRLPKILALTCQRGAPVRLGGPRSPRRRVEGVGFRCVACTRVRA